MTHPTTNLIHHPYVPPEGFEAPQPGVFKASTVFFPTVAAMRSREWKDKTAYTYGLHGTPTSYALEERLATLEGGKQCLLVPSGLAALGLVALSLLKSGDEVLLPDNVYGPNKTLVEGELMGWGITHQYYNPMDPEDLEAQISSRTKLVWLEAAGSVTLEFPNLVELVHICQRRKVLTALDNTWGAGLAFAPFDLVPGASPAVGVDISAHALTKYPSGGGDVLMGSVITRDAGLHLKLKLTHMRFGLGVGMNDVELVLRSLPSIALRYRAHDAATRVLAAWAQTQPEFVQVLHPSLQESPGHAHWMALCGEAQGRAAGLFSVILDARFTRDQTDAFCNALRLFRLGYSWGGPISLVVPYDLDSMRSGWPSHLLPGTLVRFSVGLEDVADLQTDITQALNVLR
ncbi:PLP-dependent transferase [Rhodoferax sp. AJA081-3]|uniref:PLP-dependent transferase n=1 Tax=Rhodoferax sp. AJA081-3 TaxID=2752316 RepID=UPI001ADF5D31|nr:PLP-dependent transferase [Rhodoferax sp. AJA081-3]QTN28651.1 PLP-dependent transferase [Rhodoferax sp. AJA081-3]